MRVASFVGVALVFIGCGGSIAPGHESPRDDAGVNDAAAGDAHDRPDAATIVDAGAVDAQVASWCGYSPDFSSVSTGCGNGCLVALRRTGGGAVLANAYDGILASGARIVGGDDTHLWVESRKAYDDDAILAFPSQGGAATRVAAWSNADLVASASLFNGTLYYARDGADDSGAEISSFYQWPVGSTAQPTAFGPTLTTLAPPPWDTPSIVVDGDYVYTIRSIGGVDRMAIQSGNELVHIADGPLLDALIADGSVFVIRRGGTIDRVPLAGGPAMTIASLPPFLSISVDIDRASHTLLALGWNCYGDCAEYPGSELFRIAEDGSGVTPLTSLDYRAEGLAVEGSRAYFSDECMKVPEGTVRATRYLDIASGELHWVGDEPGFPFVPYALGVRGSITGAASNWVATDTSIYAIVVGK